MNIIQSFYDNMASHYDKLFLDWDETTREQAEILDRIFRKNGFDRSSKILDCACGIGTQAIGLTAMGYYVTGSDISEAELSEAQVRAQTRGLNVMFKRANFCALAETFHETFDILIAMDNALPHMLTSNDLASAIESIVDQTSDGGMIVVSIRDYDALLQEKPPYSPPYIHKTVCGQRVSFQTWEWEGDLYKLTQYIIEDEASLQVHKFECEYRAVYREEMTNLFVEAGCSKVQWMFPEETGFYQPIVIAKK